MRVTFGQDRPSAQIKATQDLTSPIGAGDLFDPALPLPLDSPPVPELPDFTDLLDIVPDPYAREIEQAYVAMIDFATVFWPAIKGVVDAEPVFEWLMHADIFNLDYRDHIVHQTRVAAIGDLLLGQEVDGRTLLTHAADALKGELKGVTPKRQMFVRLAWWLAALFHDCAQGCELHHKYCSQLAEVYCLPVAGSMSVDWSPCFRHMADVLGPVSARDIENCQKGRHCFLGAAELLMESRRYEEEVEGDRESEYRGRRRALFRLAAKAIRRHHYPAGDPKEEKEICEEEKIGFSENPLGFLLILSDEIDEVGRQRGKTKAVQNEAGEGHTLVEYVRRPVASVTAHTTDGDRKLVLTCELEPHTAAVDDKPVDAWCKAKEDKLRDSLRLGPDELFSDLKVVPHLKAAATP